MKARICYLQILQIERDIGQIQPNCLRSIFHVQWFQILDGSANVIIIDCSGDFHQSLIQEIKVL